MLSNHHRFGVFKGELSEVFIKKEKLPASPQEQHEDKNSSF